MREEEVDEIVTVQTAGGKPVRVVAEVISGVWAVHVSLDKAHQIGLGWTLTHVQTGRRIAAFPKRTDAEGAAMELTLQKWSGDLWLAESATEFMHRSTQRDREIILEVVRRHGGYRGIQHLTTRGAA